MLKIVTAALALATSGYYFLGESIKSRIESLPEGAETLPSKANEARHEVKDILAYMGVRCEVLLF